MPWGLFECPACKKIIERDYHNGIRQKTCGCISFIDVARKTNTKHGECINGKSSHLYHRWRSIKKRCYDPKNDGYKWYGARGIKMCDEWKNDFKAFKKWVLKNGYQKHLHIDRKNNDGNYSPENCQFITHLENSRKQTNVKLNFEKAQEIRKLYQGGMGFTHDSLGKLYGVCGGAIHKIVNYKSWSKGLL